MDRRAGKVAEKGQQSVANMANIWWMDGEKGGMCVWWRCRTRSHIFQRGRSATNQIIINHH